MNLLVLLAQKLAELDAKKDSLEQKIEKKNNISLEVNENNESAINLYKKYKFEEVGRRKKYYNKKDDAILHHLY